MAAINLNLSDVFLEKTMALEYGPSEAILLVTLAMLEAPEIDSYTHLSVVRDHVRIKLRGTWRGAIYVLINRNCGCVATVVSVAHAPRALSEEQRKLASKRVCDRMLISKCVGNYGTQRVHCPMCLIWAWRTSHVARYILYKNIHKLMSA
jgi:hypothetical protein